MKPFNKYFDHTLLKADATEAQIRHVLEEAQEYDFASVCVNGCYVRTAAEFLEGTDVKVACVVGFPLGAQAPNAKAGEVLVALADGAAEIDMVLNIGAAKDGRWDQVTDEIRLLAGLCHRTTKEAAGACNTAGADGTTDGANGAASATLKKNACADKAAGNPAGAYRTAGADGAAGAALEKNACADTAAQNSAPALLKVILETCLLTDEEIVRACRAAAEAGADFVKTSTGFSTGGATVHHVQLMKQAILDWENETGCGQTSPDADHLTASARPHIQIKASGGIRTLADARAMIDAGADRLGCSASVAIMQEYARS